LGQWHHCWRWIGQFLTAALKPLRRRLLIKITTDHHDHRARLLELTSQGRRLRARAVPVWPVRMPRLRLVSLLVSPIVCGRTYARFPERRCAEIIGNPSGGQDGVEAGTLKTRFVDLSEGRLQQELPRALRIARPPLSSFWLFC
jgi:DNA-binding MarR family transcriptional regulator